MRRLLVTGASGFVGRHLLPALRSAFPNACLIAATRGPQASGWDAAIRLDLLDSRSCAVAIASVMPDAVVHLAAFTDVGASFKNEQLTWRTNLLGTLAIADAVRTAAPEALFLHASTAEVYGLSFQDGHALNESAGLRPANPYAAAKAAAELAVGEMALRGLRAVRLRPFNHTGTGQGDGFVVSAFARQVAMIAAGRQEPVLLAGALDRWRDFLDVRDVCAGYVAVLQRADAISPGSVFNLASGSPRHIGSILNDLMGLAGVTVKIEQKAGLLRTTDIIRTAGDARSAHLKLDWTPRIPWEQTLAAVLQYWRAQIG